MGRDKNPDTQSNTRTYAPVPQADVPPQQFNGEVPTDEEIPAEVEAAVVELSIAQADWGHVRVSNELQKQGIDITPAEVRDVWEIWSLQTRELRLQAQIDGVRPQIEDSRITQRNRASLRKEIISIAAWAAVVCVGLGVLAWYLLRR